jgi:hypothetical protein
MLPENKTRQDSPGSIFRDPNDGLSVRLSPLLPRETHPTMAAVIVAFELALIATLAILMTGCLVAREGSTIVRVDGSSATNAAALTIAAAANGANAQHALDHGANEAKGSASMRFASKWLTWVIVGIVIVIIVWAVWKFAFTGARLAILP